MSMEISVRYVHNDMIKPFNNGGLMNVVDSMTHKVMISDTTLRLFIPSQVRKMTPKLRQICGCELCIITKYMQIYLNIPRTRLVTYLQNTSVEIHTHNSLFITTSTSQLQR